MSKMHHPRRKLHVGTTSNALIDDPHRNHNHQTAPISPNPSPTQSQPSSTTGNDFKFLEESQVQLALASSASDQNNLPSVSDPETQLLPFSSASGPSSLNKTSKYDVFLNFSIEDVGKGFLSHLFHALKEKSIVTFKDDEILDRGRAIAPNLLKAIEGSSCSVVVLSKNYAFSAWCLDELVTILDCHERIGQRVYLIYYDVDPTDVRKQRGSFGEAFARHEQMPINEPEKIQRWRSALLRAADFPGWSMDKRNKAAVFRELVAEITKFVTSRANDDDLIGFDKHLKNLKEKMCLESENVRFIGICGKGGIGKTALARKIYDIFSFDFEHRSFLANVAEHSDKGSDKGNLVFLQKQLLSEPPINPSVSNLSDVSDGDNMIRHRLCQTKCFIVIDGIDDDDQLNHLAGKYNWFGPGSRIIITSRDKDLLNRWGIEANCIYEPQELNHDEALRLVSLRAFQKNDPPGNLMELCKCIVEHTFGIPLALEVFGSLMYDRPSHECVLLMRNVKEMGRMIVEDITDGHWKGRRFWRDKLSCLLVPATECILDMGLAHNDSTRKIDMEWIFTMTNFSVELSSAVFDQLASPQKPHYALIAIVMSFASVFLSSLEFVYKARKEKIIWRSTGRIPWFYYPSPRDGVRFGSFADVFGLVCSLFQSIVVTINYFFVARQASSPIKISVWPMVFAFFVLFSKVLEARDKVRPKEGINGLRLKVT